MLYDPKWAAKPNDPYTINALIWWLEQQNPRHRYDFMSARSCLLARYFTESGFDSVVMERSFVLHGGQLYVASLPPELNSIAETKPWTMGAALKRARKLNAVLEHLE